MLQNSTHRFVRFEQKQILEEQQDLRAKHEIKYREKFRTTIKIKNSESQNFKIFTE